MAGTYFGDLTQSPILLHSVWDAGTLMKALPAAGGLSCARGKLFLCFPRAKGTPLDASSGRISAKGPPHDSCARPVRIQFFDVI